MPNVDEYARAPRDVHPACVPLIPGAATMRHLDPVRARVRGVGGGEGVGEGESEGEGEGER